MRDAITSWEVYSRSVVRFVLAFTFSLHGYRHWFGLFPVSAGRRAAIPMALDGLPPLVGGLEIAGGLFLFAGLLTRPTAIAPGAWTTCSTRDAAHRVRRRPPEAGEASRLPLDLRP